jgi:hypothetical protein
MYRRGSETVKLFFEIFLDRRLFPTGLTPDPPMQNRLANSIIMLVQRESYGMGLLSDSVR